MIKYVIGFCSVVWLVSCSSLKNESVVLDSFHHLDEYPRSIEVINEKTVNNEGGHLQGVQLYSWNGEEFVILSGSSSSYSYYGVARMNEEPEVISVNTILQTPFKHAGGFQIFENYFAVGIEDNEERTRSKVYLYHLQNPENPPKDPITVINREGAYERATAGAVGLTKVEDRFLMVVADWDSRHLDFYISETIQNENHPTSFRKVYTIETEQIDKKGWSDSKFHSYQNVNFIGTEKEHLFLVGLGQDQHQQNITDLFTVSTREFEDFTLQKIATKTFKSESGANFRSGAGITFSNNQLRVISCPDHLLEKFYLNVYNTEAGE